MGKSNSFIYWLSGRGAKLEDFPWGDIEKPPLSLSITPFSAGETAKVAADVAGRASVIVVLDIDNEKQAHEAEGLVNSMPAEVAIVLLAPSQLFDQAQKSMRKGTYLLQKPLRRLEFFLLIEKMVLLEYYKAKTESLNQTEKEWLARVEQVFELSRKELLDRERTTMAYERLVEYEEHLLEEQRRINRALLDLQEFRDNEKLEWEKERSAREKISNLQREEMQVKDQTVKAQENLLEFNRSETAAYLRILKEFESKGTLSKQDIQELLDEHKKLLNSLEGQLQA